MNHTENEKSAVDLHLDGLVDYDRKKSELTQPNSQFDEELLLDGITLAVAYFEGGIRDFDDYAVLMIDDVGNNIKPYLLSFWEGIRDHPLFETEGMTSVKYSRELYEQLLSEQCDINDRL